MPAAAAAIASGAGLSVLEARQGTFGVRGDYQKRMAGAPRRDFRGLILRNSQANLCSNSFAKR